MPHSIVNAIVLRNVRGLYPISQEYLSGRFQKPALLFFVRSAIVNETTDSGSSNSNQTGIAASISQPSLSSSSARFEASSEATSMRRNLSPWLQYSLVNPITAGAPGCRQRHVDPTVLIKQERLLQTTLDFVQMSGVAMGRSDVGIDAVSPIG